MPKVSEAVGADLSSDLSIKATKAVFLISKSLCAFAYAFHRLFCTGPRQNRGRAARTIVFCGCLCCITRLSELQDVWQAMPVLCSTAVCACSEQAAGEHSTDAAGVCCKAGLV